MKKRARLLAPLFACLLIFSAVFGGCGDKEPTAPPSPLAGHAGGYDTSATISYKELQATATVSQPSPDSCSVTFTAPESLRDMAFVFRRDTVEVTYRGLGFQFDPDSVPGGAVANMMVSAINTAMKDDGVSLSLTDAGMEIAGMLEVGAFTLRLDADSGNLLKLSVPSEELEIEFANFRFLD